MNHFYQILDPKWFNFQGLYRHAVETIDVREPTFIELGVYQGSSTAFMAVEIANSQKPIAFHAIDKWDWDGGEDAARRNLDPVKEYVNIINSDSSSAANLFADRSIDFLFIDAGHDYLEVRKDIDMWLPKMKPDSIMAGHDYFGDFPGVIQAVNETWPNAVRIVDHISWMVKFKNGEAISNYV